MTAPLCSAEIHRRAARYLPQQYLRVDFYRIRQRLAIALPVSAHPVDLSTVRNFPGYPYAVWVLWELEERILSLGAELEISDSNPVREALLRDLQGLFNWKFPPEIVPGLWSAHLVRILVTALGWEWPDGKLRRDLLATLGRLVDHMAAADLPTAPSNHIQFANIAVITDLGWAIGARAAKHASAENACEQALAKIKVWLDQGLKGHSEGVCYDGYVADFLMDFFEVCLEPNERELFLGHLRFRHIMASIESLGAPTRPENIAPLGDIEPEQMPFHYSFAIKFLATNPGDIPFQAPRHLLRLLRCDALSHLPENARFPRPHRVAAEQPGDALYALVWNFRPKKLQAKAVVAWSNSSMGHLHCDAGHLVIAAGGEWMITDPGYQQYIQNSERDFTLGPSAHNQPVINGYQASQKPESREFTQSGSETLLDLSATYPAEAGLKSVQRSFQIAGQKIIVRDRVAADSLESITYSWHAHPEAFLRVENGRGLIVLEDYELELLCRECPLETDDLRRLRGSRGSLTFQKTIVLVAGTQEAEVAWELALKRV